MKKTKSTIAIYSGGLDSTVMLYKLAADGCLKGALSFNYGQKHCKEISFAKFNCDKLNIPFLEVDLRNLAPVFGNNSLTDQSLPVPDGHYEAENMRSTVVPNRNMIMLSIAAARAISLQCNSIAYAAHWGDHAIYPDCREEFTNALAEVFKLCHYEPIELLRPFVNTSKAEIVKLGVKLGVDFSKTWSCYKGEQYHCGTCGTCTERREAFALAGVDDPTVYKHS